MLRFYLKFGSFDKDLETMIYSLRLNHFFRLLTLNSEKVSSLNHDGMQGFSVIFKQTRYSKTLTLSTLPSPSISKPSTTHAQLSSPL